MTSPLTISVFGLTLPVPRWTVSIFGVLAVCAVSLLIYQQACPAAPELVTLKQANDAMATEIAEYGLHMAETPEQAFTDVDGQLRVQVYRDHCVLIQRIGTARGVLTRLVPDLARAKRDEVSVFDIMPIVEAASGRCVQGAHPGRFVQTYGDRVGCLVEVWRRYEDGCTHVQWMDACAGTFDTNSDGTPRVRWTACVH